MDPLADRLFHCALDILMDLCPRDGKDYLCRGSTEYDETACQRCWAAYLFRVMNQNTA